MGNLGGDGMGGGGGWNPGMAQALGYGYGMPTQAAPDYRQMFAQQMGGMRPSMYAGMGYPSSYGYGSAMPMMPGGGGMGGYGGMGGMYGGMGGMGNWGYGGYTGGPLMNLGNLLRQPELNPMAASDPGIYAAAQQAAAMTPEQRQAALNTPGSVQANAMQQYQAMSPADQQRIQQMNAWNMSNNAYSRGPSSGGYWGQVAQNYKAMTPEQQQNLDTSEGSYWGNLKQQFGQLSPGQQATTRGLFG